MGLLVRSKETPPPLAGIEELKDNGV